MKKMTPLITRFAPSPSGPLHLGHAYAAIIAHEAACMSRGRFLLRIEDLDVARARAEFEQAIHDDLSWLGLKPDGVALRQSERMTIYAEALAKLRARGLIYPCFCTRREIAAEIARMGQAPQEGDESETAPPYPGICRALSDRERTQRISVGVPYVMRLDQARALSELRREGRWPATFVEAWAAGDAPRKIAASPESAGDIVLARKDVPASYHLAVVIDDAACGINAVTRGEDLLSATHIQVLLLRLLGLPTPAYGHHALVRDDTGRRLAKRDEARALLSLREAGWDAARVRAALPELPDLKKLEAAARSGAHQSL